MRLAQTRLAQPGEHKGNRPAHPDSFLGLYQDSISKLAHDAKTAVRRLDKVVLEAGNTQRFLQSPWREWFLTCAEMAVSVPASGEGEPLWQEPVHKDGGASVLHIGMTLYGRRHVRCQRAEGDVFPPGSGHEPF